MAENETQDAAESVSQVAQRYGRVADGFTTLVRGVRDEQWASPTPCDAWDVRALVAHVVDTHWRVAGSPGRSAGPAGDLVPQWSEATAAISAALDDPDRAAAMVGGMFGEQSFASLVGRLLCADTLFHTWDLARATGQDETLDPDAVTVALRDLLPLDDAIRRPGGFAPKVEPAPGADLQTRFLNFGGRTA